MWKLLRNSIIVAVLAAGALKLVLWYEIQQGGARLTAQLAPVVQLQYGSISASLGGEVDFSGVSVAFGKDKKHDAWHASSVELTTPGALWLARRLLLGDDGLPGHLIANIKGLQPPTTAFAPLASWLSPLSFVPFEAQGCGVVTRFSVADYQRMGINPGLQQQRIEYRYDPATALLSAVADMRASPFSAITVHAELQKFAPQQLAGGDWSSLHVGEISVAYADTGYLARRNRFCAQEAGVDPAQFVDQHVAAVQALLGKRGVEPSAEVTAMYRALVQNGGRVSVLSLPTAGSTLGQILSESPGAVVRRLNLTARRNDAPPVMVRLAFRQPPEDNTLPVADVAKAGEPAANPAPPPALPTAAANANTPVAAPAHPMAAPPAAVAARQQSPAKSVVPAETPRAAASPAAGPAATGRLAAAPATANPIAESSAGRPKPAQAATPPGKAAPAADVSHAAADPAPAAILPSGPAPPPNSTLALVWKPTLDRLEEAPPPARDYDVIEYSALNGYAGRYVRLVTTTGKKVEGRVVGADATSVALRIRQAGGTAELQVPRNVITEIQLPRARAGKDRS